MTERPEDIAARKALHARQGGGARYDAVTAPHDNLLLARRGLPSRALRHLYDHSAKHLDVEWRDLPADRWDMTLTTLGGDTVTARDTPMIRAEIVWRAAIDLGNGGRPTDVPRALRQHSAK